VTGNRSFRGVRTGLRRLALDLTPLRTSRDYRLLWFGEIVSATGTQITVVAVFIQVFEMTGSSAAVGAVGLAQLVPLVLGTLLLGPIIDSVDRRKLLIVADTGQALASGLLLLGALSGDPPLALVYVAVAISAGFSAVQLATRSAIVPNLVPESMLPSALALNQVMWNTALIAGPAIGGVIVGRFGLGWAYGIDLVSFFAGVLSAVLMSPRPPVRRPGADEDGAGGGRIAVGLRSITEGFRFLKGRRALQSTFVIDLVAMIFGMPRALFPVLAITEFHRGEELVGLLFSAVAVGALLGALTTGWVRRIERQGMAVVIAVCVWGVGIAGFGLSGEWLVLALMCLAVAGAADVISAVFRSTILQTTVPDDLRGRMSAVHILVVVGGPRIGDFEAGAVASLTTPAISVVSGGLACIAGSLVVAAVYPELRRYRAPASWSHDSIAP
jgi:MFS family permease